MNLTGYWELKHTIVAHPEANLVSEHIHFSIKSTVKVLISEGYIFDNAVKTLGSNYNSSFHTIIQTSPNKVHFERELANIAREPARK